jgi:hypothetical protein
MHDLLRVVGPDELTDSGIEFLPIPGRLNTDYTVIGGESFLKSVSAHCSHPVNSTPRLEVPRGSEGPLTNEPMFVSAVMLARVLYPTSTYPKSQKRDYTVRHTFGTRSVLHAPAIRLFVIRAIGAFVCLCRPVVERACVLHSAQHVFCRISVSLVVQDATPAVVAALLGAGMARLWVVGGFSDSLPYCAALEDIFLAVSCLTLYIRETVKKSERFVERNMVKSSKPFLNSLSTAG